MIPSRLDEPALPQVSDPDTQCIPDLLVDVVANRPRHLQGHDHREPDVVIRVQSTARRVAALDPNRQGRAVLEIGHPYPIMDHPPRPEGPTLDHLAVQVPVLHCQMPPPVCRTIPEFIAIGGYGFQCSKPIPGPARLHR